MLPSKIVLLFLIDQLIQVASAFNDNIINNNNFCESLLPRYCFCKTIDKIECLNFTSLKDVQFERNQVEFINFKIRPLASITFNNDLSFIGFRMKNAQRFRQYLSNIDSFELTSNPFTYLTQHEQKSTSNNFTSIQLHSLLIDNSSLLFLYRNKTFEWYCDLLINDSKLNPIFSSFKYLYFGFLAENSYQNGPLCPIVFKNANLDSVFFSNLTLINRPSFIQIQNNSEEMENWSSGLNAHVRSLHIQSSDLKLDSLLLDRHIFKHISKLSIEFCNLSSIDDPLLFRPFSHLKEIRLWLFNFEEFITSTIDSNKWMKSLNQNLNKESSALIVNNNEFFYKSKFDIQKEMYIEFNDERNVYKYPDADFCLFKHFPHQNFVYPIIKSSQMLNCTCTILFLIKNWNNTIARTLKTTAVSSCFRNGGKYMLQMIQNCNLDLKLKRCFMPNSKFDSNGLLLNPFENNVTNTKKKSIFIYFFCVYFVFSVL
jgi:hypothetical protein